MKQIVYPKSSLPKLGEEIKKLINCGSISLYAIKGYSAHPQASFIINSGSDTFFIDKDGKALSYMKVYPVGIELTASISFSDLPSAPELNNYTVLWA